MSADRAVPREYNSLVSRRYWNPFWGPEPLAPEPKPKGSPYGPPLPVDLVAEFRNKPFGGSHGEFLTPRPLPSPPAAQPFVIPPWPEEERVEACRAAATDRKQEPLPPVLTQVIPWEPKEWKLGREYSVPLPRVEIPPADWAQDARDRAELERQRADAERRRQRAELLAELAEEERRR